MSANKHTDKNDSALPSTADLLREKFNIERRLKAINEALDMVLTAPGSNGHAGPNGFHRLGRWDSK